MQANITGPHTPGEQPVPSSSPATAVRWLPMAVWVGLQALSLAAAGMQVRLWARQPDPAASAAVQLGATDVISLALLFPWLLADLPLALTAAVVAWPFMQLAALLSITPVAQAAAALGMLTLLIAGGYAWTRLLPNQRAQMSGLLLSSGWTIGGIILCYLRLETAAGAEQALLHIPLLSPLLPIVGCLSGYGNWTSWMVVGIPLATAVCTRLLTRLLRSAIVS